MFPCIIVDIYKNITPTACEYISFGSNLQKNFVACDMIKRTTCIESEYFYLKLDKTGILYNVLL